MIITLCVIALFVVGIMLMNYANKHFDKDIIFIIGVILFSAMGIGLIICGGTILDTQINKSVDYQNALYEKEMLEYRIENMESDIVGNEMLYNDIVEFNNNLRGIKKWADNPLTNWFYNQQIADIDYVEIK